MESTPEPSTTTDTPAPTKEEPTDKKPDIKPATESAPTKVEKEPIRYFQCTSCSLNEKYQYFGHDPPNSRQYKLLEDSYVIPDPFVGPKEGEFVVLGAHCVKCNSTVCRDSNCSFYFGGTYCIRCAKSEAGSFPQVVQERINRIVV